MIGFAGPHRYASVFLQFTKVILNQMPPFAGFLVKLRREFAVGFQGDNRGDASRQHVIAQPIGIKGAISATVTPEKLRDFDAVLGRQGSGSSGTPKFEDEPEFAAKQLEFLNTELANGAALVQRREDGMYVKRVIDGEDIELGFSDELSGLKHEQ